ncbi:hypothetical protein P9112_002843 [Eukaryota sp. TZLM1-RC]
MDLHKYLDEQLAAHGSSKHQNSRPKQKPQSSSHSSALDNLPVVPSVTIRSAAARSLEKELELLRVKAGELNASLHPSSFTYPTPTTSRPTRVYRRECNETPDGSDTESICSLSSTSSRSSIRRKTRKKSKGAKRPNPPKTYTTLREMNLEREVSVLEKKVKSLSKQSTKITKLEQENQDLRDSVRRLENVRLQQRSLILQLRRDLECCLGMDSGSKGGSKKVRKRKKKS